MPWADFTAGQTLTAAKLNELASYAVPISATKASDTSRNTTASPSSDPELSIVLPANATYEWSADCLVSSAANAAGDFRIRMAWTNTATVTWRAMGLDISLASSTAGTVNAAGTAGDATSPTSDVTFGASTAVSAPRLFGEITTGGSPVTLTVEWAQSASNANNTSLLIGSRLWARRIG